ncbi:DUF1298 domain-containing protein [Nocardia huaxiensis]|uniref:DUF1298 domain-containing protein n=1 Tax=Nocardia huaxiensis TaxID=2755382 RepID=A0A7D6VBS2_9NOCA|nr:wax ester/triacylglycerol synthase domain-containing protein [Nocardia huaxiensis]QLY31253.1 DUF1298 domain-containing protein [Nocardia huaxiensis]
MNSLAPRDATMYWLSARTRNDLFLLYCFADTGVPTAELRETLSRRIIRIPDLLVHVLDTPANIAYPIWAPCEFIDEQCLVHDLPEATWANLTTALGDLLNTGVQAQHRPWRLHLFRDISNAPGFDPGEPALVAVLQLSHALTDGRRAAEIARTLFTDTAADTPPPSLPSWHAGMTGWSAAARALPRIPIDLARTVIRGVAAARAQRELSDLTAAGMIPPPPPTVAPNAFNGGGAEPSSHAVRMLVRDAAEFQVPGFTVTTVAATAISLAMQRYLVDCGHPTGELRAQIPMAVAADEMTRNSYRDLSIDLCTGEPDPHHRAARIAAELITRRTRAEHPLQDAQSAATAALPAPLLHRDVTGYPINQLPEQVSGHTVISSVHRGPADLTLGGGPVRFTAGFPALGSVMHLTHGVHGLGDTVTISVHADPEFIDVDSYAGLLDATLSDMALSDAKKEPARPS